MRKSKVLELVRLMEERYAHDPVGWIAEFISFDGLKSGGLTWQQKEIANALAQHKNVCVSAGGGIGKSALVAMLILWFLSTHPLAKVPVTAPTGHQLQDVLWSELHTWLRRCKLRDMFELRASILRVVGFDDWFSVPRTISRDLKDVSDTLAGFHAPHLMFAVDEASGVPDQVFTAIEGALTNENSYVILISNPVSTGGYYYDTINDPEGRGRRYKVLFYDARESPLVAPEYAERIKERWGENSAMFIAKVMGRPLGKNFTVVVDPNTYDETVQNNRLMFDGPVVASVDPSGSGEDLSVICFRRGLSVFRWDTISVTNPTELAERIIGIYRSTFGGQPFACIVDGNGLGAGVYSHLSKFAPFATYDFIGQSKARDPFMFARKRVECYYKLHTIFSQLHFPTTPPERLKKELANLKFIITDGPIDMEPKEAFKKRVGFSPDYADALMMSLAFDVISGVSASRLVAPTVSRRLAPIVQRFGRFEKFVRKP